MSYDIAIASIPKTSIEAPILAPPLLKAVLQNNGFTCKTFDWNYDLYKKTKGTELGEILNFASDDELVFSDEKEFEKVCKMGVEDIILSWVEEVRNCDVKWLGLSLFSNNCIFISQKILTLVRKHLPNVKIVVGSDGVRSLMFTPTFGEYLKNKGLIDHYITGEAENALVHLLNGNLNFNGIDGNKIDTVDLNIIPTPDYSDLNINNYSNLWVMGSRGCINRCAFCDSKEFYGQYRCRRGKDVADELMFLNKKYGIIFFNFADNLINGNLNFFRDFCTHLKDNTCGWYGQTVCNPKMKEEDFRNASNAGLRNVTIGIESGVERIRKEMNKNYSNHQLYKYLGYLKKYNIKVRASMIVGWFTETEEDFQETLAFLTRCKKENLLAKVSLGGTLSIGGVNEISPGLPMRETFNHLLTFDEHGKWVYKDNTMKVRLKRWGRMRDHCISIGLMTHQQKFTQMNKLFKIYFGDEDGKSRND